MTTAVSLTRVQQLVEYYTRFVARRRRAGAATVFDSDDVRQELFLTYMHALKEWQARNRGPFEGLLIMALRNRSIDLLRRCYRKREDVVEEIPESAVEVNHDAALEIEDVMANLTPRQRSIVMETLRPSKEVQNELYVRKLRAQKTNFRQSCDEMKAVSVVTGTSDRTVLSDMQIIRAAFAGVPVKGAEDQWSSRLREARCARHGVNKKHLERLAWKRSLLYRRTEQSSSNRHSL